MIKPVLGLACLILITANLSCVSVTPQIGAVEISNKDLVNNTSQNTNYSIKPDVNVSSLCANLQNLKRMPFKDLVAGDPIYDGLIEKGQEAVPCLIRKITDKTLMEDPRQAPHVSEFVVGDAAVFMLEEITDEYDNALPQEVVEQEKTEGVYAYFYYVQKPGSRKKIQQWWLKWYKDKYGKDLLLQNKS